MAGTSFERFTGSVTRWRDRVASDPFASARVRLALLYFLVCSAIFLVVGIGLDGFARRMYRTSGAVTNGTRFEATFSQIQSIRWTFRAIELLLFGISAYVIAGWTLRPIKRATEFQNRFMVNASHELRTPLTVARTASELALRRRDALTLPEAVEVIETDLHELDRLSRILQFLLLYSNLEQRRTMLDVRHVRLGELVESVRRLTAPAAEAASVRVETSVVGPESIRGNDAALEQLLTNLIENAVRHSAPGGVVNVSVVGDGESVALSVSDEGEGIDPADLPFVFEPFYRGRSVNEVGSKRTGLGLSIVKEICAIHGARATIESEPGKGTTVRARFTSDGSP